MLHDESIDGATVNRLINPTMKDLRVSEPTANHFDSMVPLAAGFRTTFRSHLFDFVP
jgi:hypothetical protein